MKQVAIAHQINSRVYSTFDNINIELQIKPGENYLFDLSYLSILDIDGNKAAEFLQGQLTCDMNRLSENSMIQGAQCNLQGRILTFMDVIQWNGIKLIVPADLAQSTINSLLKTAQLSRVSISENDSYFVFGMCLQNTQEISLPKEQYGFTALSDYCIYHLGREFYIAIVANSAKDRFIDKIKPSAVRGSLTWHTLRLQHMEFSIYPESRGLFIPHRLGLHQTSLISFNKGCYKGQEIIARLHYKSTIKHHLQLFTIKTKAKIHSGQKIISTETLAEIGELIDFSLLEDETYIIAMSVLKDATLEVRFEGNEEVITLKPFKSVA